MFDIIDYHNADLVEMALTNKSEGISELREAIVNYIYFD